MDELIKYGGIVIAYLLGSIPTSIWVGKIKFNLDIREHGSGNAGATNTFRVLGKKAGIFVMTTDILKGIFATSLPLFLIFLKLEISINELISLQIAYGMAAVLGHVFPIYERFKGGKGVATLLGMVIAINHIAALICLGVFLLVLILSKYVSLGSMIAAFCFPLLMIIPGLNLSGGNSIMIGFGVGVFILVVFTHKKNIKRLVEGNENKTYLIKKKETN